MRIKILHITFVVLVCIISITSFSQCPIDTLGQNPSTAFPVCGTTNFIQSSVHLCGGKAIKSPKCNSGLLTDINPYWYKFTCFEAGTLGFSIDPNSATSDYDWQVFDITGRNPDEVYTDPTLGICSNWSQYYGKTGTSAGAANLFECEGPVPQLSKLPTLVKGHQYLLLVSHFTQTQEGYKLSFGGGTASITDTTPPRIKAIYSSCDAKNIGIKLNKKMKCSSLAANGTDFKINALTSQITGAKAASCSIGFDMDSVELALDKPLPPGRYTISVAKGTDGNTLLDNCDNSLPVDDSISILILPGAPTPMDSIEPVLCKPTILHLDFKNPMLCSSIAADGSDFSVTGPSAVAVTGASGNCLGGVSSSIIVKLANPILVAGIYTITLKKGSDGNTIFNACAKETPAGSALTFKAYDTVSAAITYATSSSCIDDTLKLFNAGQVNITSWKWYFDDGVKTGQAVKKVYSSGTKTIVLEVSNGVCNDSAAITINFDKNRIKASFIAPEFVCPLDTAYFENTSTGPAVNWNWDFGNGVTSQQQQPPYQFYPTQILLQRYTVTLHIMAENGCSDSISHQVQVPGNCYIAVPNAFTPNGDGLNDFLYPLNAYKAINLNFKVYNRYGQLVWQTTNWTKKWDGRVNGNLQASGTYVWHLIYTDTEKGRKFDLKGTTSLIR